MRLAKKVALITGAASGIGRATADRFAQEGASVVIADLAGDQAEAAAAEIVAQGGNAVAVLCDVSSSESAQAAVTAAVAAFGGLDILIGNAGVRLIGRKDVVQTSEEDWDLTFSVNTRGNFLMAKFAVPELRKRNGGSIAFTSSVTGSNGQQGYLAYGASKGALIAMTKTMAVELAADNIRVNCVSPGGVQTAITDQTAALMGDKYEAIVSEVMRQTVPLGGTMMDPLDIANAFLYLASDDARRVTGSLLVVDSGWSAMLPRANLEHMAAE